jgi:hypothetical protein
MSCLILPQRFFTEIRRFFRRICDPADCLNYLLPNERSSEVACRLCQSNLLPGVICRNNRYFKSFNRMLKIITNFNTIALNSAFWLPFTINLSIYVSMSLVMRNT